MGWMKERTKISLHLLCGLGSNVMNEISLRVVTLTFMHLTDAFIHVCHLNLIGRDVAVFFFFFDWQKIIANKSSVFH